MSYITGEGFEDDGESYGTSGIQEPRDEVGSRGGDTVLSDVDQDSKAKKKKKKKKK